ncbi:hypothetical protein O7606_02015 [Micromonospora sp. WMMD882]|uniref:hypothetical protein n=1 Tax=Micromonospora sp. WMMD882 TaxID=3015151 RepID=UPI00248CD61A|nr:hypothetical protein [Micromonospora sp. WMMD882]WBB80187.1 hypothetical protein O7606_02015 [Micromonospora sp. WMMD882]
MSNYLRKNDEAAPGAAPPRNRHRLWLATGAAGLASVVGLGAIGVVAATGAPRLTGLSWAGAQSVLTGDGTAPGGKHPEAGGQEGTPGDSRKGRPGEKGEHGEHGQHGRGPGQPVEPTIPVPCNRDALFSAVTEANYRQYATTLHLAEGCTYDLRAATNGDALPPVTVRLTIIGKHSTIERAYGTPNTTQFRLFHVANGGQLTLKGVTLRNGLVSGPGGAVLVDAGGEAAIEHSTLTANAAVGLTGTGGAIQNNGITTLRHTRLTLNNAAISGGAVNNTGALLVEKSQFEANKSAAPVVLLVTPGGGAVRSTGTAVIRESRFLGNESGGNGGGLQVAGGVADVEKSEFALNTAAFSGGAIAVEGGALVRARKIKLVENTAVAATLLGFTRGGGGIYNAANGTVNLAGGKLVGNSAGVGNGGGILNLGALSVHDSHLAENQATLTGGGLYNGTAGVASLVRTTITLNQALVNGGGIFNANGTANSVTLDVRSRVVENNPDNCAGTAITNCQG